MSNNHDHHHHHGSVKNIKVAFFLNLIFTIFEIIGGLYINSIAIISDAIHDLGDTLSLGTSWYLQNKSKKKPNKKYPYGYGRFSLLGALINSLVLIFGSGFVIYEAIKRIIHPEHADPNGMLMFAIVGIVVNGYAAYRLSAGNTMNEKVVSWHLIEDVLGWVAVLIVSIILKFKDIQYLDPALSLVITVYILWNVIGRLKETLHLFLQGTPKSIDLEKIKNDIAQIPGVNAVIRLRIWSTDGEHHVADCKIKLLDSSANEIQVTIEELRQLLLSHNVYESTIET